MSARLGHRTNHGWTRFTSGTGVAVVGPDAVVLLGTEASAALVARVAAVVLRGAAFDSLADALLADGIGRMPSFACATFGATTRLLVRGGASVSASEADGQDPSTVDAPDVGTWREVELGRWSTLTLRIATASGPASEDYAVTHGIVPAATVSCRAAADPPAEVGPAVDRSADLRTVAEPVAAPERLTAPVGVSEPVGETEPAASPVEPTATPLEPPEPATPVVEPTAAAPVSPPPPSSRTDHSDLDYGHLLGYTQYHQAESAAVRNHEDESGPAPPDHRSPKPSPVAPNEVSRTSPTERDEANLLEGHPLVEDTGHATVTYLLDEPERDDGPQPAGGDTSPDTDPLPTPAVGSGGLIDRVPWRPGGTIGPGERNDGDRPITVEVPFGGDPPLATDTASHAEPVDDPLDDLTVARPSLRRETVGPRSGAQVQAVRCPQGHANPPPTDRCRMCGASIADRDIILVARPPIGVLRFEDGNEIIVDQPLLLGRSPSGDLSDGRPARAHAIDDPEKLLSRVHIEIRIEEWQVQVVDRDSMNHTYVDAPGQPTVQLLPGEPCPIGLGTRVVLGDAVAFTFEPPAP